MMTIGDRNRWWNRTVWECQFPWRKVGKVLAIIFVAFIVWELCGQATLDLAWGVWHNRTVDFRGQRLQLPWFWRADEVEHDEFIVFRHTRLGLPLSGSITMIVHEEGSPETAALRIRDANDVDVRLQKDGWSSWDDPIDPRFACIDRTPNTRKILQIDCYSLKGQWSITTTMIGEADRPDFEKIVHQFAAMGPQAK